jgi:hypothetical protein
MDNLQKMCFRVYLVMQVGALSKLPKKLCGVPMVEFIESVTSFSSPSCPRHHRARVSFRSSFSSCMQQLTFSCYSMQRLLSWRPRKCTLLALSCVSASSSTSAFLTSSLDSRAAVCRSNQHPLTRLFSSSTSTQTTTNAMTTDDDKQYTVAFFPCLNDNYGFLLHSDGTGETAAIDTPDAKAYQASLDKHGWKL